MPIDESTANRTAELFATLSDPSRVRIIDTLLENQEMNVSALAECLAMSESAVSHQLRLLRHTRLVRNRKKGRQVYYSLDDEHVVELFQKGLNHILHG
jgi:DNA-binding transcriptional ArsR family regulator